VTGTNGKTTISRLVAELLMLQGQACAVMGTTGNGILPNLEASSHTTLDALHLQNALHTMPSKVLNLHRLKPLHMVWNKAV
jgi:UDP-N-acetylmuramoyl-L-alanyl-D-glutamate--2,6-diaminopimelate ligase